MTRGPLVSIIIPCFNAEAFISDAIRSAVAQSYPNTEVIVVDDGSRDRSVAVVQGFGARVRLVTGPNAGGSRARNKGLSLAQGEYIQFLDADDLLHPLKVERQLDALGSSGHDAVYSDWTLCELHRPDRATTCRVDVNSADPVVLALNRQHIQTEAPLHRRATLDAIGGFREDLPCCQERDLMLRLARHGARFSRVPGVLHTVRAHVNGVSADELRVLTWMRTILEDSYEYLSTRGELTDERKRAFAELMARQGRVLFRYRKPEQARQYFAIAARMHAEGGFSAFSPMASRMARTLGPGITEDVLAPVKAVGGFFHGLFAGASTGRAVPEPMNVNDEPRSKE
jgi:glycosyltransferase involved in cell wall biosynthesis